jgi:hypothetical protein
MPADSVYAGFQVGNDTFDAWITDAEGIGGALSLWDGDTQASIPSGLLVWQPVSWNAPWSWYLDPSSVIFAARTAEFCDGTPSYVEESGPSFGKQFCPWTAVLVSLQDVNGDPIPRVDPLGGGAPEPPTAALVLLSLIVFFKIGSRACRCGG